MAVSKVIYNGTTLIDLTGDTIAADKILSGYVGHNAKGERVIGTASAGTVPTNGSLIVCHCSTDITSVEAVYDGITAGADLYTSTHLAYITIPHTFTGTVTVKGYAGNVLRTSSTVLITTVDKYECQLSTSSLVYGLISSLGENGYNGIGEHRWLQNGSSPDRTAAVEENLAEYLNFHGTSLSFALIPAIHNRGYSNLKITTESANTNTFVATSSINSLPATLVPLSQREITIDVNCNSDGFFYLWFRITNSATAHIERIEFV